MRCAVTSRSPLKYLIRKHAIGGRSHAAHCQATAGGRGARAGGAHAGRARGARGGGPHRILCVYAVRPRRNRGRCGDSVTTQMMSSSEYDEFNLSFGFVRFRSRATRERHATTTHTSSLDSQLYTHTTTRVATHRRSQSDAAWRPTAGPSLRTARHTCPTHPKATRASAVVERAHAELLSRLTERRTALADHRRGEAPRAARRRAGGRRVAAGRQARCTRGAHAAATASWSASARAG